MTSADKVSNVNIANAVTILRLLLVPLFIWVFLDADTAHRWAAAGIFWVAAATDKLDGYLARSRGLITDFGKLADSIADKALVAAALILLSAHGMLWWWVTILMLARELGITLMRMALVRKEVMAAGRGGKLKMVLQVLFILGLLIPWHSFLPNILATACVWITWAMVAGALILSLLSAAEYVRDAMRISKAQA